MRYISAARWSIRSFKATFSARISCKSICLSVFYDLMLSISVLNCVITFKLWSFLDLYSPSLLIFSSCTRLYLYDGNRITTDAPTFSYVARVLSNLSHWNVIHNSRPCTAIWWDPFDRIQTLQVSIWATVYIYNHSTKYLTKHLGAVSRHYNKI